MRKEFSVLPFLTFLCFCILPFFRLIGWIYGYNFVLRSYPVCSIVLAVISIIVSILLFKSKKLTLNKINIVFSALLLPISIVNAICYISQNNTKPTVISTLISCCCAIAIFCKFARPRALKIISGVLSVLLFLFLLLVSILGIFRSNTIVKFVPSPQYTYVAEVIDNNQGALGGNTFVDVKNNNLTIDLFIGKFSKPPIRVYTGKWGEFNNMQILWKNENVLIIDGKEYYISD